jgi:hypothetical protein
MGDEIVKNIALIFHESMTMNALTIMAEIAVL